MRPMLKAALRLKRRSPGTMDDAAEPIRGLSRRVIVLPSPDKRIFQEAVFILRDDYLRTEGISRRALLQQADACAQGYLARCIPARRLSAGMLWMLALAAVEAAAILILILWR